MASTVCGGSAGDTGAAVVLQVDSPNVKYSGEYIESTVDYPVNYAVNQGNTIVVNYLHFLYSIKCDLYHY